jgi:hypothetical protein
MVGMGEARSRNIDGVWEWARKPVRPKLWYSARMRQRQTRRRDCVCGVVETGMADGIPSSAPVLYAGCRKTDSRFVDRNLERRFSLSHQWRPGMGCRLSRRAWLLSRLGVAATGGREEGPPVPSGWGFENRSRGRDWLGRAAVESATGRAHDKGGGRGRESGGPGTQALPK